MTNKLTYALEFVKRGIAVIPLRHRGKEPESRLMGGTCKQFRNSLPTEYQVNNWLASGWQNYGVVCGWKDLTVIDFDNETVFAVWMQYASVLFKHDVLPIPFMVKTRRGAHVYVVTPGINKNKSVLKFAPALQPDGKMKAQIDVVLNGYVVGPASIHPSGATYQAMGVMVFPEAYDLETLLPPDLFPPMVTNETPDAIVDVNWAGISAGTLHNENYDPFQIASGSVRTGDLIQKVKSIARIENLFPDAQKTSGNGQWFAVRCLFHDDHKASAWVDVKRQIYGCRVCQMKPMDAINLYARTHRMSDAAAVSAMARDLGVWAR